MAKRLSVLVQEVHDFLTANHDCGVLDVAWDDDAQEVVGTQINMDWQEASDMGATHIIRVTCGCGRAFRRDQVNGHLQRGVETIETGHDGVAGIEVVYELGPVA